ncbi:hypothetical protein PV08_00570 [Exophiala spinifera]|uniref:Ig-like domain-containing protein n=1 Tax=Exophiala spinifera TaxID=91928 RepID=A0A0D2BN73_9EURO|nr:uncharacterized protein PV08_00570 [Exophiala spinifera]KIW19995.1 hypothetical protein PV08_00570 [Exophiala spinifera]
MIYVAPLRLLAAALAVVFRKEGRPAADRATIATLAKDAAKTLDAILWTQNAAETVVIALNHLSACKTAPAAESAAVQTLRQTVTYNASPTPPPPTPSYTSPSVSPTTTSTTSPLPTSATVTSYEWYYTTFYWTYWYYFYTIYYETSTYTTRAMTTVTMTTTCSVQAANWDSATALFAITSQDLPTPSDAGSYMPPTPTPGALIYGACGNLTSSTSNSAGVATASTTEVCSTTLTSEVPPTTNSVAASSATAFSPTSGFNGPTNEARATEAPCTGIFCLAFAILTSVSASLMF